MLKIMLGSIMWAKGLVIFNVPFAAKSLIAFAVLTAGVITTGLPVHDPWFDLVLLMAGGALVGGAPEPDQIGQMGTTKFLYTWAYRSSHLFISSATAYMIHPSKWKDISGHPVDVSMVGTEVTHSTETKVTTS